MVTGRTNSVLNEVVVMGREGLRGARIEDFVRSWHGRRGNERAAASLGHDAFVRDCFIVVMSSGSRAWTRPSRTHCNSNTIRERPSYPLTALLPHTPPPGHHTALLLVQRYATASTVRTACFTAVPPSNQGGLTKWEWCWRSRCLRDTGDATGEGAWRGSTSTTCIS